MSRYEEAKAKYLKQGIDVDKAIETLKNIPISIHCWQGDDVTGFENMGGALTGGIQATGNYPGKARTPDELMADFEKAISLIPGKKRINLHACYAIFEGEKVERDELKQLIRKLPFVQIAKMYNVTDNAIKKWCIKYGLPSKRKQINKISDEDWDLL